jgi:hypothetical protein
MAVKVMISLPEGFLRKVDRLARDVFYLIKGLAALLSK